MNKKVLFCATVDSHIESFHIPYMKWFIENGWEVHVAAKGDLQLSYVNKKHHLPIERTPFSVKNILAYKELKRIIESNHYKIIHCHTPMAGLLTRLAARHARDCGTKVIYTAHGFHFYKGAALANWLVYYPIERWLARYTDCLITINHEDFHLATNSNLRANQIEHVHGVGVDTNKFKPIEEEDKLELRKREGFNPNDFLMVYAAEFNANKNQQILIRVLAKLAEEIPNVRLLLVGNGPMMNQCRELSQNLGVAKMVNFLGYRKDLHEILPICDIIVASSYREGLPVNIMEAMACALPVVASDNRGHRELIFNNENGWLIGINDVNAMSEKIKIIAGNKGLKSKLGCSGRNIVQSKYAINQVLTEMSCIYSSFMD